MARLGVVGTGRLGTQLTEFYLRKGYEVTVKTRNAERAGPFEEGVRRILVKEISPEDAEKRLQYLRVTEDFEDLSGCEFVIESVIEDADSKMEILHEVDRCCDRSTVIATNTSSISIEKLAGSMSHPERFIGIHYFNPVRRMALVEVITGCRTSEATLEKVKSFIESSEKTAVIVQDSPAFIVNRLLLSQINEAVRMLEEGVSDTNSIDTAIKFGLNHPMGPLELADYIGIDVCVAILDELHRELEDSHYEPAKTLTEMVKENRLGVKTKNGFYKY